MDTIIVSCMAWVPILLTMKSKFYYPVSSVVGVQSKFIIHHCLTTFKLIISERCLSNHRKLDSDTLCWTREHVKFLIQSFMLDDIWDMYGINTQLIVSSLLQIGVSECKLIYLKPLMNNFPWADIYQLLSPDLLHQIIKGAFKDHLIDWVQKYICLTYGAEVLHLLPFHHYFAPTIIHHIRGLNSQPHYDTDHYWSLHFLSQVSLLV